MAIARDIANNNGFLQRAKPTQTETKSSNNNCKQTISVVT